MIGVPLGLHMGAIGSFNRAAVWPQEKLGAAGF